MLNRVTLFFQSFTAPGELILCSFLLANSNDRALTINRNAYLEDILRKIQGHNSNQLDELFLKNWNKL
jgi:hypothetical protein